MEDRQRTSVPKPIQVEVFYRDGWLCRYCRRPTVFPPTFKLLSEMANKELPDLHLAIWNRNWRRDQAPLLDELGASLDHVHAFVEGGAHDISNFATACWRCNARKSNRAADKYLELSKPWKVKGKHGEPEYWDGLASIFVVLARKSNRELTVAEKEWLQALEAHYVKHSVR